MAGQTFKVECNLICCSAVVGGEEKITSLFSCGTRCPRSFAEEASLSEEN